MQAGAPTAYKSFQAPQPAEKQCNIPLEGGVEVGGKRLQGQSCAMDVECHTFGQYVAAIP